MCGIAGFCTIKSHENYIETLNRMSEVIKHRGPDDEDIKLICSKANGSIGLAFRRLSIIDLSDKGRQPMLSSSGKSIIVFNGEIYNYKILREELEADGFVFNTHTDTEVILGMYEKYGEKCVQYLNGMFAFVLYDYVKDLIFIARDRLGVKPLYYCYNTGELIFASEIKAILEYPGISKRPNYLYLQQYVQNRYIRNPHTMFEGIYKLEPGCFMEFKNSKLRIERYWDILDYSKKYPSLEEARFRFDELFHDSVSLRMISDAPLGAFLSGGLDSSLIVAMMYKHSSIPIKTYSVGFEKRSISELEYARTFAKTLGTNHHELTISHKHVEDNLYKAVWFRDAPISEPSDIPIYLLSKCAKNSVSAVITGEGSDEFFAGYPKYSYDSIANSMLFKGFLKNNMVNKLINSLPYKYRREKLAYNNLCSSDMLERFDGWFAAFHPSKLKSIFSEEYRGAYMGSTEKSFIENKGQTDLDKMLYYDIKYWLSDNILERGDKMMMAASIEGRYPFLDYRIGEYSFNLKDKHKIKGLNRKYIVKKFAESYIPKEIINRKKNGFYTPVGDWFRKELKDFAYDHLLSDKFKQRGIFDSKEIENMLKLHCNSVVNYEKELWTLLNLEIWFRVFIDK